LSRRRSALLRIEDADGQLRALAIFEVQVIAGALVTGFAFEVMRRALLVRQRRYSACFGGLISSWAPLARTTVGATLGPGSLVEIEAAARRR
jgi:hypothetical protein